MRLRGTCACMPRGFSAVTEQRGGKMRNLPGGQQCGKHVDTLLRFPARGVLWWPPDGAAALLSHRAPAGFLTAGRVAKSAFCPRWRRSQRGWELSLEDIFQEPAVSMPGLGCPEVTIRCPPLCISCGTPTSLSSLRRPVLSRREVPSGQVGPDGCHVAGGGPGAGVGSGLGLCPGTVLKLGSLTVVWPVPLTCLAPR